MFTSKIPDSSSLGVQVYPHAVEGDLKFLTLVRVDAIDELDLSRLRELDFSVSGSWLVTQKVLSVSDWHDLITGYSPDFSEVIFDNVPDVDNRIIPFELAYLFHAQVTSLNAGLLAFHQASGHDGVIDLSDISESIIADELDATSAPYVLYAVKSGALSGDIDVSAEQIIKLKVACCDFIDQSSIAELWNQFNEERGDILSVSGNRILARVEGSVLPFTLSDHLYEEDGFAVVHRSDDLSYDASNISIRISIPRSDIIHIPSDKSIVLNEASEEQVVTLKDALQEKETSDEAVSEDTAESLPEETVGAVDKKSNSSGLKPAEQTAQKPAEDEVPEAADFLPYTPPEILPFSVDLDTLPNLHGLSSSFDILWEKENSLFDKKQRKLHARFFADASADSLDFEFSLDNEKACFSAEKLGRQSAEDMDEETTDALTLVLSGIEAVEAKLQSIVLDFTGNSEYANKLSLSVARGDSTYELVCFLPAHAIRAELSADNSGLNEIINALPQVYLHAHKIGFKSVELAKLYGNTVPEMFTYLHCSESLHKGAHALLEGELQDMSDAELEGKIIDRLMMPGRLIVSEYSTLTPFLDQFVITPTALSLPRKGIVGEDLVSDITFHKNQNSHYAVNISMHKSSKSSKDNTFHAALWDDDVQWFPEAQKAWESAISSLPENLKAEESELRAFALNGLDSFEDFEAAATSQPFVTGWDSYINHYPEATVVFSRLFPDEEHKESAILQIKEKFDIMRQASGLFDSTRWAGYFQGMTNGGVLVVAESKTRARPMFISREEINTNFGGNRLAASQSLIATLKKQKGFSRAKEHVFDGLDMLFPDIYEQSQMRFNVDSTASTKNTDSTKRADFGVVRGFAKKHLAKSSKKEILEHLELLPAHLLADRSSMTALWPSSSIDSLRKAGLSPEAVMAYKETRKVFKSKLSTGTLDEVKSYALAVTTAREFFLAPPHENFPEAYVQMLNMAGSSLEEQITTPSSLSALIEDDEYIHIEITGKSSSPWNKKAIDVFYLLLPNMALLSKKDSEEEKWAFLDAKYGNSNRKRSQTKDRFSLADAPPVATIERSDENGPAPSETLARVDEGTISRGLGLSGIEYGNWTNQKEREQYIRLLFDSMHDLAEILDVDVRALASAGSLGMAFASRGNGGRSAPVAHFEPANQAINLTRKNGAGSLCHEMGHMIDNGLSRIAGLGNTNYLTSSLDAMIKKIPDKEALPEIDSGIGGVSKETIASLRDLVVAMRYVPTDEVDGKAIYSLSHTENRTDFYSQSASIDREANRTGKKATYWQSTIEMFARSFELWAYERLTEKGISNNYLVSGSRLQYGAKSFPQGEEKQRILSAFDTFAESLSVEMKKVDHLSYEKEPVNLPILHSFYIEGDHTSRDARECLITYAREEAERIIGKHIPIVWGPEISRDGTPIAGQYIKPVDRSRLNPLIKLAYGNADKATVHHEIFHACMDQLLPEIDKKSILAAFAPDTDNVAQLSHYFSAKGFDLVVEEIRSNPEEAAAYGYQLWCDGKFTPSDSKSEGLFSRIKKAFKDLKNHFLGLNYQTPEAIFSEIKAGEYKRSQLSVKGGLLSKELEEFLNSPDPIEYRSELTESGLHQEMSPTT